MQWFCNQIDHLCACEFRKSHTHTLEQNTHPHASSPSADLLMLSCRLQVQLSFRANALRQQCLCVSQPLTQVIHVTVELPPLFYGTVKTPAAQQQNRHTHTHKSICNINWGIVNFMVQVLFKLCELNAQIIILIFYL